MSNQQQVEIPGSHQFQAARWCEAADREAVEERNEAAHAFASVGQLYASLAIAEQLERLNDKLDGADIGGQFGGFLDGLHHSITEIVWQNTGGGR